MKKNIAVSFFLVISIGNLLAQTLTIQVENTVPGDGDLRNCARIT